MKSVYLLTRYEYGEYDVVSAWSDKAAAERQADYLNRAARLYEDAYSVQEVEFDPAPLTDADFHHSWHVRIFGQEPDGFRTTEPEQIIYFGDDHHVSRVRYRVLVTGGGVWHGDVYAETPEKAVKSAYDRAAKAKAERLGL